MAFKIWKSLCCKIWTYYLSKQGRRPWKEWEIQESENQLTQKAVCSYFIETLQGYFLKKQKQNKNNNNFNNNNK